MTDSGPPAPGPGFAPRLLDWYRKNRRQLPWRDTCDPYAIWVSEAMLQQTRVDTVIPYYQRFLQQFPTVEALACAPIEAVLKCWEGLGYYSRARNLHKAAGRVAGEFGGRLPDTAKTLATLPGIGPYMAGAVASIAFGRAEPVLDGNVERVLTRLYAIGAPVKERATQKQLWAHARALLATDAPGDFNQALMELGATVCHVRAPSCEHCPVANFCAGHAGGDPTAYPNRPAKKKSPHHHIGVALVTRADRVLLVHRPQRGLLGGLWEFPGGRCQPDETPEAGTVRQLTDRFGLAIAPTKPLESVRHAFTHFSVTLHPFVCAADNTTVTPIYHQAHRWVDRQELVALPLSRAHQKIAENLFAAQPDQVIQAVR